MGRKDESVYYSKPYYNETEFNIKFPCGFLITGRPSLIKMKIRLHKKKCHLCSKEKDITEDSLKQYFQLNNPEKIYTAMKNSGKNPREYL